MYTATVSVHVTTFRKTNGEFGPSRTPTPPYIDAELTNLVDTSPGRTGTSPTTFTLDADGKIHVKVERGYRNGAQIRYQLPSDAKNNYVMLGIAFAVSDEVGRDEFPEISIVRDPTCSIMTVTNMCDPKYFNVNFTYGILIQDATSGDVGIYDPGVVVEPIEHLG